MRSFRKLTLILILLFTATAGWAAVYAYDKGFTKKWRQLVNDEFRKYGIEASIGKLTLDPFQGLVARDVKFYQDESRRSLLAAVSRITLDIDLIHLLEKQVFLNTIDIRNANVSLPVDPEDPGSERLELQNFNARLLMPGDRIEISQAHGSLQGVDVAVRGSLFRPDREGNDTGLTAIDETATRLDLVREGRRILHAFVDELGQLEFSRSERPSVTVEVSGDLVRADSLRSRIRMQANNVRRGDYQLEEMHALIELAHARVSLKELYLRDEAGELVARADHVIGSDRITTRLQSSLDLHRLLGSFLEHPALGEVVLYEAPKLYLEGDILLDPEAVPAGALPVECVGSLRLGTFASRGGVIFDSLEADFSIDGDRYYCRDLKVSHRSGTAIANGLYDSEGLRYDALLRLDPAVFVPFAKSERTRDFLSNIKLNDDSSIYFKVSGGGPSLKLRTWHSTGELDARNLQFKGQPIERLETRLEFDRHQHYYRDVKMTLPDGAITASYVSHNIDSGLSEIRGASGTVYPAGISRCFNEGVAKSLEPYRFDAPPFIKLAGTLDPRNRSRTDFNVEFKTQRPVAYDFLGETLRFDSGEAQLHFQKRDLTKARIEGNLFGGELRVDLSVSDLPGSKAYKAGVRADTVRFRDLATLYGYHDDTAGELTGHFDLKGRVGDPRSIDGSGTATIVNGDVFAMPVLGPLSKLISDASTEKKAGHSVAREVSADLTMKNGIVATENLEALATSFRLRGAGFVDTNRDTIRFDARINARGAPGILLLPVSKLLEYTCEGSLSNPVWRPKHLGGEPSASSNGETAKPPPPPLRKGSPTTPTTSRSR